MSRHQTCPFVRVRTAGFHPSVHIWLRGDLRRISNIGRAKILTSDLVSLSNFFKLQMSCYWNLSSVETLTTTTQTTEKRTEFSEELNPKSTEQIPRILNIPDFEMCYPFISFGMYQGSNMSHERLVRWFVVSEAAHTSQGLCGIVMLQHISCQQFVFVSLPFQHNVHKAAPWRNSLVWKNLTGVLTSTPSDSSGIERL